MKLKPFFLGSVQLRLPLRIATGKNSATAILLANPPQNLS